jgi:uncharacterized protein YuzE
MRFEFDPESGAIYVRIRDGEIAEMLEIADPSFGAYLDVDQEGNVLGVTFLPFKEFAGLTTHSGGKLESPDTVREPDTVLKLSPPPPKYGSEAIREALSSLGPRQQELLRLRYFEGYTSTEIADHLRMPVAAVNNGTRSALEVLRGALDINTLSEANVSNKIVAGSENEESLWPRCRRQVRNS